MTTADLLDQTRSASDQAHSDIPGATHTEGHAPLFADNEAANFRSQWQRIQGSFVDEPRKAVEDADELVASTIQRLAQVFADERAKMEQEWSRGDEVSTEDLRQALRRYRSFFDRLLSV
jgi:hypothetical protein